MRNFFRKLFGGQSDQTADEATRRVYIEFSPKNLDSIQEMQRRFNAATIADTVKKSLALASLVSDYADKDGIITILGKDSSGEKVTKIGFNKIDITG